MSKLVRKFHLNQHDFDAKKSNKNSCSYVKKIMHKIVMYYQKQGLTSLTKHLIFIERPQLHIQQPFSSQFDVELTHQFLQLDC